jgi:hypothetical protein
VPLKHVAALALAAGLSACGGGGHASPDRAAAPRYLAGPDLERQLGNGFRAGLERLAAMSQPADDAADLGQPLPTGLLDRVTCGRLAARPAAPRPWLWRCTVRWETAGGRPRRTAYDVRLLPTGCFAAGARPPLPPRRDATIKSFSEHPLNAIVSVRKGC